MATKVWTDSEIILAISQAGERLGPRQQRSETSIRSVQLRTTDCRAIACVCCSQRPNTDNKKQPSW